MRIGFVYDMIYPFSKGGAEKRFHSLAVRLAKRHEVHMVGLKLWDGPATVTSEDGIILHGVTKAPGRMYVEEGRRALLEPAWFGAALLQWPGLRRMDVIDCSSFPYFSVFTSRLLAAWGKTPMVVTWHEVWDDYWRLYAPRVAWIGRLIERFSVNASPHAVSVSETTRRKLVAAGMAPSRVSIVPNGIDLPVIQNAKGLPDAPDILFAGRLIKEKGVGLLLDALASEPLAHLNATCWIVGVGADAERLQRRAGELELNERVRFMPWLSEGRLYGAMKGAKAVALLSEREGFGMVVLEAMAAGTPVVVSTGTNSAAPDLVEHGRSGYVTAPVAHEVAEALAAIVSSDDRRTVMGRRGAQLAAAYTWDVITERMERVYWDVTGLTAPAMDDQPVSTSVR